MKIEPRMIFDDKFLRLAWHSTISIEDIAAIYGTSRAAIYRAAIRFRLGRRQPQRPRPEGYKAELMWSEGRWSLLADIAGKYGRSTTQVQADYHRTRADHDRANRTLAECRAVSREAGAKPEADSDRAEMQRQTRRPPTSRVG